MPVRMKRSLSVILMALTALITGTPPPCGPGHWEGDECSNRHPPHDPCLGKCLASSLKDFGWTVSLEYHAFWYFTTPSHQNSWGTVTFNLTNPAVGTVVHCAADSDRLSDFFYGDQWYSCLPNTAPALTPSTSFRFLTHTRLDINQTWVCNERKPGSP